MRGSKVALGAQDCHMAEKGAHTGDISPLMLKDLGCTYVLVGHSERRADHLESNEVVCKKAQALHTAGLKAVICIGETLAERESGKTIEEIDVIAVTYGAGLIGALLVGVSSAKALAYATKKPLIKVNHIEGHICSNFVAFPSLKPPFISCVLIFLSTFLFL